jgi:hypothetical protein
MKKPIIDPNDRPKNASTGSTWGFCQWMLTEWHVDPAKGQSNRREGSATLEATGHFSDM